MENDERCEHGTLWKYECATCEKENDKFFMDMFRLFGDGDLELGKKRITEVLRKKEPRDDPTRASESK